MKIPAIALTRFKTRGLLVDEVVHQGKRSAEVARVFGVTPRTVGIRRGEIHPKRLAAGRTSRSHDRCLGRLDERPF